MREVDARVLVLTALAALAAGACAGGRAGQRQTVAAGLPAEGMGGPVSSGASRATVHEIQRGEATWYGRELAGSPTASGERFDPSALTCAHRTFPMGTRLRVTNEKNGRTVEVRVNDRGPYGSHGRIIDLSEAAARALDMIDAGVVPVSIEVLSVPKRH